MTHQGDLLGLRVVVHGLYELFSSGEVLSEVLLLVEEGVQHGHIHVGPVFCIVASG